MGTNRVELARPFAVVEERTRYAVDYHSTEDGARSNAERLDRAFPKDAPHIVVRLTAERVEEPIPEAKSGWKWRVSRDADDSPVLYLNRGGDHWEAHINFRCGSVSMLRPFVPPCDHAHVAELLRREGVPQTPTVSSSMPGVTASHFATTTRPVGGAQSCNLAGCTGQCGICNKGVEDD